MEFQLVQVQLAPITVNAVDFQIHARARARPPHDHYDARFSLKHGGEGVAIPTLQVMKFQDSETSFGVLSTSLRAAKQVDVVCTLH